MLARIEFAWRWLGTAFSYLVFGLGGLVFTILAVPVLFCLPGGKLVRARRAQKSLHYLLRAYVRMMSLLGVVSYQIEGIEKLRGSRLILANHPSLLDVVFLIALVPNACCVVKGKLTRNFFTRGPIKTATGKATPLQERRHEQLRERGYPVFIVRSLQETKIVVEAWMEYRAP